MELYLFRHHEWEQLYNNCSKIDITPIPWEDRRFVPESLVLMVLAPIYYILYIPCIYSFLRNWRDDKGRPNPCYQIMFYISILDIGALWIISLYSGSQFLVGAVYCSAPTLNYFLGEIAMSLIQSEALADVILALDRCVEVLSPNWSAKLFKGNRLWFGWLLPATLYGINYFWMNIPIVFNGATIVFSINPYDGFWDDHGMIFQSTLLINIHQYTLFFGTLLIYTLFLICLAIKMTRFKSIGVKKMSKMQKNVPLIFTFPILISYIFPGILSSIFISLFNMVTGGIYHVNEHFPGLVSPKLIFLAHFSWVHIHGIPPVIYLIFNNTIRKDVQILFMKIFRRHRVGHLHGVTVIVKPSDVGQRTASTQNNMTLTTSQQENRQHENENALRELVTPWTTSELNLPAGNIAG